MTWTEKLAMVWLQSAGYSCFDAGGWNGKCRKDLLGFADLIAFDSTRVFLVQATAMSNNSVSNFNARCRKIEAKPAAGAWLANSLRLILVAGFKPHGNKPILLAKYHGSTCDYFSDSDDILRAVEFDCKSPISGEN